MTPPEQMRELEIEAKKKAISFILQTIEQAGEEFEEIDVEPYLEKYLVKENKSIIELNQEDLEKIFSDFLVDYLDSTREEQTD
ncbi:MAG: hypothetical protein WC070_00770 [Candidatus Magasanikbacteria bacterium]